MVAVVWHSATNLDYLRSMYGAKVRSAIGGLYAWRANHTEDLREMERMRGAADLAFRQAIALCPYSPEACFRYVNLPMQIDRPADALLVAEDLAQANRDDRAARDLVRQLKGMQKRTGE